jgi:hypothetical protein
MKEMTGFNTTEEEFEALPMAVRRKVCGSSLDHILRTRLSSESWDDVGLKSFDVCFAIGHSSVGEPSSLTEAQTLGPKQSPSNCLNNQLL